MSTMDHEDELLRSVALQNANAILAARHRAEEELVRTREALRESQERLTPALTAAGTGTFRWNIQTNTVEWDGNIDRLFGLDPHRTEQSLDAFITAVHPDDRAAVLAGYEQSARGGSDFEMEFRVVWSDGSVRWIHEKAKAFCDDHGRPLYLTGACADITSRKQAAEALRASEERLRAIFNQAAVGITVAALDGRFVEMNRKCSDILGYTADELRQLTFADITHRADRAETADAIRQLLAGTISDCALEKRYVRKDESVVWSLTTVTLLKDASGKPLRFIGIIEDITARKQAEAALREETRILELLNKTGQTLASKLDLESVVQAMTDAGTELSAAEFGAFFYNTTAATGEAFPPNTIAGASRDAFETFRRRATALFAATFRGEPPIRCHDVLQDERYESGPHNGVPYRSLPVRSYLAVPVRSRSGEVIGGLFFGHSQTGVFTDRTERLIVGVAAQAGIAIDNARLYEAAQRAAEERKILLESERAARTEAERMSEVKDAFLATLSHELRTPLNAILGWSLILRTGARDGPQFLKALDTIERNARVQTQLIEDLLDMSRITSGKLRLDVQPIHPASVIEAAVETVRPAADAKGIRLETFLDPNAGPMSGDPGRIQQVAWNLLSNAIKFTPNDGKVQVTLTRVNSHIELTVADTGVGIKPEFLPHLFERFRQADASTTRKFGGLGLGLSIVKSLVELHGGTIQIQSEGEGRGTTAIVCLPLMIVHRPTHVHERRYPSPLPASSTATATATEELQGIKVLVVDDQEDARDLLKRVLEESAAEVVTAASADEAVALLDVYMPDILISDIGMPDADGFDLLRRVRALPPDRGGRIPAIALTAFARSEDRTRALRAGFLVHVSKPVDPSELVATVASVAGRVRQA